MLMRKHLKNYPKRREIHIADLNPSFGHEIHKKRPILIISDDSFNQTMPTVVVLPLSSIVPKVIGPDLMYFPKIKGLDKKSVLLLTQTRAVDKDRIIGKVGRLPKIRMAEVENALKLVLGISETY